MDYHYYVGIDVSKLTLDCTVLKSNSLLLHKQIENTKVAIRQLLVALKLEHRVGGRKTLFCIEHMGSYNALIVNELLLKKAPIWLESALHIKRTLGLQRGKSDEIDSYRIAQFAYLHRHQAKLWEPPRAVIEELKYLRSIRNRLITAINQLKAQPKEMSPYLRKKLNNSLAKHYAKSLESLQMDLVKTEESISQIITSDPHLNDLYGWITSVKGVGSVIATEIIITTNEFKSFQTPKQYACYCGVVPFEYTSGTSLTGKGKVSKFANKRMKTLLHLAAIGTVRSKGELRDYYDRKVAEGRNKMSVLNAVRNKLILRIFACVRNQKVYENQVPVLAKTEISATKAI